ncbi:hypothetical protein KBK19_17430 [Microvirga sp. STR05]|uniref:GWxTD domain-containing protein n=1 Tax=Hymenobacter duratus TaxID=2771356 RepID=A0ABR8JQJ6_9BACT|nr:hypothetical protein [Hymenobacter duratus]MBD2716829.1 hypothetical protein [Hymenobacter duratus]MBR7951745.1 hypothetical protein [Microvirga sp. STR05]
MLTDSTVQIAAGPQYQRSGLHTFFWGKHYRDLWALPVTVPVLNLRTVVPGGLTPVREGGSFQTKNLRLVDRNGVQYVLRSVDKDATKALPEGLQDGPIGRLMKDQTSVINPYGAYVVPRLARAAGVYHTNPRLVYVGDDPALGEYRQSFANALYLLEERPEGDQSTVASFGNSSRVESSRKVFTNLMANPQFRVDARRYLRARLFDMWLGDWSRREDQWRWASFEGPTGAVRYHPIPRDRDHAFFKFNDGLFTHMIGWVKSNYQTFGEKIRLSDVEGLNRAARPMDKSLLVYLSRDDFRQIADSLQQQLPDPVIREALAVWPKEVYALAGQEFERKLSQRRDQLPAVADKFYTLLARNIELPGTDQPERFVLDSPSAQLVRVRVYQLGASRPDSLVGQRTFSATETSSLKLFGLGGNDVFEFRALPPTSITVELYDGAGQDVVLGPTAATGQARTRSTIFESGDGNTVLVPKPLKVEKYRPAATEFDAAGWLLRHRLY